MKSLFYKMGLVLTLLISWVVYDRWDNWTAKTEAAVSSVTHKVKSSLPTEPPTNITTQVYKWKDAQGRWQFSNEPPDTTAKVTTETYNSNQNVMPRLTAEDIAKVTRKQEEKETPTVNVFTALPNAVNAARDVQGSAQQHNEQVQRALQSN